MAAGFAVRIPHLALLRTADDTSLVRMVRLIITRAVRHLAIATFQNDRWRHDLLQLRLDASEFYRNG